MFPGWCSDTHIHTFTHIYEPVFNYLMGEKLEGNTAEILTRPRNAEQRREAVFCLNSDSGDIVSAVFQPSIQQVNRKNFHHYETFDSLISSSLT